MREHLARDVSEVLALLHESIHRAEDRSGVTHGQRVGEVRDAIADLPPNRHRDVVTVAWDGSEAS